MTRSLRVVLAWPARLLALVAVVAVLALSRLAVGPVSLDALIPTLTSGLTLPEGGALEVEGLELALAEERRTVEIRARGLRLRDGAGQERAMFPVVGLTFSARALLEGRLRPTRIELYHPALVAAASGGGEGLLPVLAPVLAALRRSPDDNHPLGRLEEFRVSGAEINYTDEASGLRLRARDAGFVALRNDGAIIGTAWATLDEPYGATVRADDVRVTEDGTRATVRVEGMAIPALATLSPALAPLASVDAVAGATLGLSLNPDFSLATATVEATVPRARVDAPELRSAPLDIRDLGARARYEAGTVTVEALTLSFDGLAIQGAGRFDLGRREGAGSLQGDLGAFDLSVAPDDGGYRATAALRGVDPRKLAALHPALKDLAGFDIATEGTITLELGSEGQIRRIGAELAGAAGLLTLPGVLPEPLPLAGVSVRGAADPAARKATLDGLTVDFGGPRLMLSGAVGDDGTALGLTLKAAVKGMPLDDLHRIWPMAAKPATREWLTTNLSKGVVEALEVDVAASGPSGRPDAMELLSIDGRLVGSGATVRYLPGLPPVENVTRAEGEFKGTTLTIRTTGGAVRDVSAGDAAITIINLGTPREDLEILVPLSGPARTILDVLDLPPLGYPSRLDIDPATVRGTAAADLRVTFPLMKSLKMTDVSITASGKLDGIAMKGIAAGRDVTDGSLTLALDMHGMSIKGRTKIAGVPATIDWKETFEPKGRDPRTRVTAKARLDAAGVTEWLGAPPFAIDGTAAADLLLTIDRNKRMTLGGKVDLTEAALDLPMLGWRKVNGSAADARFSLDVPAKKGAALVLTADVKGEGISAKGAATLAPDGTLRALREGRIVAGDNDFSVEVGRTDGGVPKIRIEGASLDARPFTSTKDEATEGADSPQSPIDLTLALDRVVFGEERALTKVAGRLVRSPTWWEDIDLTGRDGNGKALAVRVAPSGDGHAITVNADDAGAALESLDITDRLIGGRLKVEARRPRGRTSAISGTVSLSSYTLLDAPVLAHVLNAMSLTGLVELMQGSGLVFNRLDGEFRYAKSVLTAKSVRTAGGALGLTLDGDIDLGRNKVAMRGTIVPVYGLNRIVGQIPILGDLLSGGAGQGIFAATWDASGSLDSPDVSVNPLAVLAPGFLRNLFFLGEGSP